MNAPSPNFAASTDETLVKVADRKIRFSETNDHSGQNGAGQ